MRNCEILIPTSFIILAISIADTEPEIKPLSPTAETN